MPGLGVVTYPVWWDIVLLAAATVGVTVAVVLGVRRRQLRRRRLLGGAGAAFGLIVASTLLGIVAALLYTAWHPNPNPHLDFYLLPSSAPRPVRAVIGIHVRAWESAAHRGLIRRAGAIWTYQSWVPLIR